MKINLCQVSTGGNSEVNGSSLVRHKNLGKPQLAASFPAKNLRFQPPTPTVSGPVAFPLGFFVAVLCFRLLRRVLPLLGRFRCLAGSLFGHSPTTKNFTYPMSIYLYRKSIYLYLIHLLNIQESSRREICNIYAGCFCCVWYVSYIMCCTLSKSRISIACVIHLWVSWHHEMILRMICYMDIIDCKKKCVDLPVYVNRPIL